MLLIFIVCSCTEDEFSAGKEQTTINQSPDHKSQTLNNLAILITFSPQSGVPGTTVTITGNGFAPAPEKNIVTFFNATQATVLTATETELTVIVPDDALTGAFTLASNNVTYNSVEPFTVVTEQPVISSFAPASGMAATSTGFPGTEVTITGLHFRNNPNENGVTFNGVAALVKSASTTTLVVNVPAGATSGRIKVYVNNKIAESIENFRVLPANQWLSAAPFGGGLRESAVGFVIGKKIYLGMGLGVTSMKDFWEYDTETDVWARKKDFPGVPRTTPFTFAKDGKGYVGSGTNGSLRYNDFWEYDPATDDWTRKADFPGVGRSGSVSFVVAHYPIVGAGHYNSTAGVINLKDFYVYSPSQNIWKRIVDSPVAFSKGFSFVIGHQAYVGSGTGAGFWEFNAGSFGWIAREDFAPNPVSGNRSSFSIGNKGYVIDQTGRRALMYDPALDQWMEKAYLPEGIIRGQGFSVGNIGYLMTGIKTVSLTPTDAVFKYYPD